MGSRRWNAYELLCVYRPGKPTDNAFAEAFNSRIRAVWPSA